MEFKKAPKLLKRPRNIGFNEDRPGIDRRRNARKSASKKHGIHAFKNPKQYRLTSCICDE
jgi:hypothetical protein